MLKIYGNKTFNAVKAVLTAEELGIDYEYVLIDFKTGEHKSKEYLKIHPLGKIPAIEHDGKCIFESNNLCRYLANISDAKLYSKDPFEASQIDQMVDYIGYHAGHWLTVYFYQEIVQKAFFGNEPDQSAIDEADKFLSQQLPYMDTLLAKNDFLCGKDITIADTVAFAMVMTMDYTSLDLNSYENICRWYEQIKERPSYAAMMKHFPGGYDFG